MGRIAFRGMVSDIDRAKERLAEASSVFTAYTKQTDEEGWSFDRLRALERRVEIAEQRLWEARYEDSQRRTWK